MADETQARDTATTDTAPDSVETPATKADLEAVINRRLGGMRKELNKRDEAIQNLSGELEAIKAAKEKAEQALGQTRAQIEAEKKALADELATTKREALKREIFSKAYAKHLIDGAEPDWLPAAAFEVTPEGTALTEAAAKVFEQFITAKPAIRRVQGGMPRTAGNAQPNAKDFRSVWLGR